MSGSFRTVPSTAKVQPTPFNISIPEAKVSKLKQLVSLSEIGPETCESLHEDGKYGLPRKWLVDAKKEWEESFDWRKHEEYYNTFPHWSTVVKQPSSGEDFNIHFVGLFSENPDAVPIMMLHGWPGSFLEFLQLMTLLKNQYTPANLPYHIIVPSLPGWGFSSKPPLDREFKLEDVAEVLNALMISLGFDGYVVQGGDIGSHVSRVIGATHKECKAVHLNMCIMQEPKGIKAEDITEAERQGLARSREFMESGRGYAIEHATRPSTIGLALSTSPVAYLAWVAEKFLSWSDVSPSTSEILQSVSLYWLTETISSSIYTYRQEPKDHGWNQWYIDKPLGYSWFRMELSPIPVAWVKTTGKLEFWRRHDKGGHFAALEQPRLLLGDVEEFVQKAWKK